MLSSVPPECGRNAMICLISKIFAARGIGSIMMVKPVLPDTDVIIDFLRGNPKAGRLLKKYSDRIILSCIVVSELYAGVKGDKEMAILDDLVNAFEVVPILPETAKAAGLYCNCFSRSHGTGLSDALIAATCDVEGAQLLTLNTKHFPMFKGLKAPYKKD